MERSVASSTRTTAVAVVVAAFVAGAIVGAAGDRFYLIRRHLIVQPRATGESMTHRIAVRLDRDLHFKNGQQQQIETIIEQSRGRIDSIWASVRPQVESEIDATNSRIEQVLDAQQRTKFREIEARHRARRAKAGGPKPPH
jgi:hypothetical protein